MREFLAYHTKCIDPWLTKNRRVCPVCKRKVITGDERPSDLDSDSEDETAPLINSEAGTQGGTFVQQRVSSFVIIQIRMNSRSWLVRKFIWREGHTQCFWRTPILVWCASTSRREKGKATHFPHRLALGTHGKCLYISQREVGCHDKFQWKELSCKLKTCESSTISRLRIGVKRVISWDCIIVWIVKFWL